MDLILILLLISCIVMCEFFNFFEFIFVFNVGYIKWDDVLCLIYSGYLKILYYCYYCEVKDDGVFRI